MTTGEKIQTLRKKQGLTQEQLAQGLGVSRQAVSRWELDEALPETANLLPLGLVVLAFLGIGLAGLWGSGGQFPTLAWIVLVQGLNLCFWFYLLCLAVYALVLLSRYLKRKTS